MNLNVQCDQNREPVFQKDEFVQFENHGVDIGLRISEEKDYFALNSALFLTQRNVYGVPKVGKCPCFAFRLDNVTSSIMGTVPHRGERTVSIAVKPSVDISETYDVTFTFHGTKTDPGKGAAEFHGEFEILVASAKQNIDTPVHEHFNKSKNHAIVHPSVDSTIVHDPAAKVSHGHHHHHGHGKDGSGRRNVKEEKLQHYLPGPLHVPAIDKYFSKAYRKKVHVEDDEGDEDVLGYEQLDSPAP